MSLPQPAKSRLAKTSAPASRPGTRRGTTPRPVVYLLRCSVALCGRGYYTAVLAAYLCPACGAPLALETVTDLRTGLLRERQVAS